MRAAIKGWLCILSLLLVVLPSRAETAWITEDMRVRQGMVLSCSFLCDASATVYLTTQEGKALQTLEVAQEDGKGQAVLDTSELDSGEYCLFLVSGKEKDSILLHVDDAMPEIFSCDIVRENADSCSISLSCSHGGYCVVSSAGSELIRKRVEKGDNIVDVPLHGLPGGEHALLVHLEDEDGTASEAWEVWAEVPEPEPAHPAQDLQYFTPADMTGNRCDHENCYWNLPMGEMNEEAIWKVLTSPVTVLDGDERKQVKVRRDADRDCTVYTGEVTYASQAVHVLEKGEEWSRIEAYSSSVEGSSVKVYAKHFTGYVETRLLREVPVSQEIGLVIDKLQQRLYVFYQGKYYATLLCSTGYARGDTPFHETPAGEYLAISHTGGFWAGNLFCDLAIRINDGILLHEVPCTITTEEDGTQTRHYERCEFYLGEKASHGCIRIQKERSSHSVNMKWLWEHMPRSGVRAKVIIWEDSGRTLIPASGDYELYYNPRNGRQYHADPNCPLVNSRFLPLKAFRYDQLEEAPFASLSRCPGCCPQLKKEEIQTMNDKNRSRAYE